MWGCCRAASDLVLSGFCSSNDVKVPFTRGEHVSIIAISVGRLTQDSCLRESESVSGAGLRMGCRAAPGGTRAIRQ